MKTREDENDNNLKITYTIKPSFTTRKLKQLLKENKILKENAENNDKVIDKINWDNQLLKKENKKLKDNWNKLKEYIRKNIIYDDVGMKILDPSPLEDYMQELQESDNNQ